MKTLDLLQLLEQMNQLIRLKATGSPQEFARRLRLSQSMMYNYLEMLRALGGPIQYNRRLQTYEYTYDVQFNIGYMKKNQRD
jgi:predicted DNA-binding transcriptional regulator YafY